MPSTRTTKQIKELRQTEPDLCCPPSSPAQPILRPVADPAADAELAAFAKAIGHPVRVRILRMLADRETSQCCHIVDELPLAQSTVSEHLRILKAAGLVRSREIGARVGYCIEPAALDRFKSLLLAF
jgi:ArsR family transcriptional regulator, arsenate/arsenite/antimonite-responsive transcriptional repressor